MPRNLKIHIAKNHQEADEWDIKQNLEMSPQERLRAARILQHQYFGKNSSELKKSYTNFFEHNSLHSHDSQDKSTCYAD